MRGLFRILRIFNDAKAISKGPKAVAKRAGRRAGYRAVNRLFR